MKYLLITNLLLTGCSPYLKKGECIRFLGNKEIYIVIYAINFDLWPKFEYVDKYGYIKERYITTSVLKVDCNSGEVK